MKKQATCILACLAMAGAASSIMAAPSGEERTEKAIAGALNPVDRDNVEAGKRRDGEVVAVPPVRDKREPAANAGTADDGRIPTFALKSIRVIDAETRKEVPEDLSAVARPYLGKQASFADLKKLGRDITTFYRNRGELLTRALLLSQKSLDGGIEYTLLRAKLGNFSLDNRSHLSKDWAKRIFDAHMAEGGVIDNRKFERMILLLNDVPGVASAVELEAGGDLGRTDLTLEIEDDRRFLEYLSVDNQGNKSTGTFRFLGGLVATELWGRADELRLDAILSHNLGLASFKGSYGWMVHPLGSRVNFQLQHMNYKLKGEDFAALGAHGRRESANAKFIHPLVLKRDMKLFASADAGIVSSLDEIDSQKTSQSKTIPLFGASLEGANKFCPEGLTGYRFGVKWQGAPAKGARGAWFATADVTHERQLPWRMSFFARLQGQYAFDNLDVSQKMVLGGADGVRAWSPDDASVDSGAVLQLELRHSIPVRKRFLFGTAIFWDVGKGVYKVKPEPSAGPNTVTMSGVGGRVSLSDPGNFRIDLSYAHPLNRAKNDKNGHRYYLSLHKLF